MSIDEVVLKKGQSPRHTSEGTNANRPTATQSPQPENALARDKQTSRAMLWPNHQQTKGRENTPTPIQLITKKLQQRNQKLKKAGKQSHKQTEQESKRTKKNSVKVTAKKHKHKQT